METLTKTERFKKALDNNGFTMQQELEMIILLVEKYNFISKSEYARKEGVSPQGVLSRLKSKKDPYIKMINKIFIID